MAHPRVAGRNKDSTYATAGRSIASLWGVDMRTVPTATATEMLHETEPQAPPIRLFAYVEAVAACGLLILLGISLFGA